MVRVGANQDKGKKGTISEKGGAGRKAGRKGIAAFLAAALSVAGAAGAEGLLTPMFPVFDGENDRYPHPGWQRTLEIIHDKKWPTVTYITYASEGYDLAKVETALLHVYASRVRRSGRLTVYRLSQPVAKTYGRCVRLQQLAVDWENPLAKIEISTQDEGRQFVVDIGKPVQAGGSFHGICLVGDQGLWASVGSIETDHPPLLMLRHRLPSWDSLDLHGTLSKVEAAAARAEGAAGKADMASMAAWQAAEGSERSARDASVAMAIARASADSAHGAAQDAGVASGQAGMSAQASASAALAAEGYLETMRRLTLQGGIPKGFSLFSDAPDTLGGFRWTGQSLNLENAWQERSAMPTSRANGASARIGRKIFYSGGSNGSSQRNLYAYDTLTKDWASLEIMPAARQFHVMEAVGPFLFVMGGVVGSGTTPVKSGLYYDVSQNTWDTRSPSPTARKMAASVVLNGRIHVLGGVVNNPVATHEVYNPETDSWQTLSPMNAARQQPAAAVVDGFIYVFGGRGPNNNLATVEVYDPGSDNWEFVSDMPSARRAMAVAVVGGQIHIMGGAAAKSVNLHQVYDPGADSWTTLRPLGTARNSASAAVYGQTLMLMGGFDGGNYFNKTEEYLPASTLYLMRKM